MTGGRPLLALAMLLCLSGCGGPLGPFAGGELTGTDAEPPIQWQSVPETIQLEVRPAQPYSVNLWSVGIGPYLYVATGDEDSGWAGHLHADRNVRVRVDGKVYAMQAVAVPQGEERQQVADAYLRKYSDPAAEESDFAPIRNRREDAMREALDNVSGTIYRLAAREAQTP